jgi:hypothetical protein
MSVRYLSTITPYPHAARGTDVADIRGRPGGRRSGFDAHQTLAPPCFFSQWRRAAGIFTYRLKFELFKNICLRISIELLVSIFKLLLSLLLIFNIFPSSFNFNFSQNSWRRGRGRYLTLLSPLAGAHVLRKCRIVSVPFQSRIAFR